MILILFVLHQAPFLTNAYWILQANFSPDESVLLSVQFVYAPFQGQISTFVSPCLQLFWYPPFGQYLPPQNEIHIAEKFPLTAYLFATILIMKKRLVKNLVHYA